MRPIGVVCTRRASPAYTVHSMVSGRYTGVEYAIGGDMIRSAVGGGADPPLPGFPAIVQIGSDIQSVQYEYPVDALII